MSDKIGGTWPLCVKAADRVAGEHLVAVGTASGAGCGSVTVRSQG